MFIKAITTIVIVLTLSIIAEKVSAKLSGILSGLPLGTTLILIFYYLEFGQEYAVKSSLYNIHGLLALLSFIVGYYLSTFYKKRFDMIVSIFISLLFYLMAALILAYVPIHVIYTPIGVIIVITLTTLYFARIEDDTKKIDTKINAKDLFYRIFLTVVFFLFITSMPKIAPVNIAGIFGPFPSMMFPLLLIVHFRHGPAQARTILKNTPSGMSSIVVYCICVHFAYPSIGLVWGTIVSFMACVIYIIIQLKLLDYFGINVNARKKKKRKKFNAK